MIIFPTPVLFGIKNSTVWAYPACLLPLPCMQACHASDTLNLLFVLNLVDSFACSKSFVRRPRCNDKDKRHAGLQTCFQSHDSVTHPLPVIHSSINRIVEMLEDISAPELPWRQCLVLDLILNLGQDSVLVLLLKIQ